MKMTNDAIINPNMSVEFWDIDKLVPYEKNAKIHSQKQVENLARLIKEKGWTQPIILDRDGVIIAGHGRRLAALHLSMRKVPVIVRADLTKSQADALRLADNQIVSIEIDTQAMQEELARLNDEGEDISGLGYDDNELDFLTADMAKMEEGVFVGDINAAVEQQNSENEALQDQIDTTNAPIGDALGFKRVTVEQSRKIRALMSFIEEQTGLNGASALIHYFESKREAA